MKNFKILHLKRSELNLRLRRISGKNFDRFNWSVKKTTNINNRTTVVNTEDNSVVSYYYE